MTHLLYRFIDTDYNSNSEFIVTNTSRISNKQRRVCVVPECTKYHRGSETNYMCINHFKLDTGNNSNNSEIEGTDTARVPKNQRKVRVCEVPECTRRSRGSKTNYMCVNHFKSGSQRINRE